MQNSLKKRKKTRFRRVLRVRKKLCGSKLKPRLSIHKTNKHLYAQIIDDESGTTLAASSTLSKEKLKKSKDSAKVIGLKLAKSALEKDIKFVIFDRGRFKFHGLIAELASGAREGGLEF